MPKQPQVPNRNTPIIKSAKDIEVQIAAIRKDVKTKFNNDETNRVAYLLREAEHLLSDYALSLGEDEE